MTLKQKRQWDFAVLLREIILQGRKYNFFTEILRDKIILDDKESAYEFVSSYLVECKTVSKDEATILAEIFKRIAEKTND